MTKTTKIIPDILLKCWIRWKNCFGHETEWSTRSSKKTTMWRIRLMNQIKCCCQQSAKEMTSNNDGWLIIVYVLFDGKLASVSNDRQFADTDNSQQMEVEFLYLAKKKNTFHSSVNHWEMNIQTILTHVTKNLLNKKLLPIDDFTDRSDMFRRWIFNPSWWI